VLVYKGTCQSKEEQEEDLVTVDLEEEDGDEEEDVDEEDLEEEEDVEEMKEPGIQLLVSEEWLKVERSNL
jgi:hypothetical protein